jgi:hypothetical protein
MHHSKPRSIIFAPDLISEPIKAFPKAIKGSFETKSLNSLEYGRKEFEIVKQVCNIHGTAFIEGCYCLHSLQLKPPNHLP